MQRKPTITPDWALMIEQLQAKGVPTPEVAQALGYSHLTSKMLQYYAMGAEPIEWRRNGLMTLWCSEFGKQPGDAPQREVLHGRTVRRLPPAQPVVAPAPASKKPIFVRRGKKEATAS